MNSSNVVNTRHPILCGRARKVVWERTLFAIYAVPRGEIGYLFAGHAQDVPVRSSAVPDSRRSCKQVSDPSLKRFNVEAAMRLKLLRFWVGLSRRWRVSTCRTLTRRERVRSEQGCLERVLQVDTRHLPLARLISRTEFAPTRPGRVTAASRRFRGLESPRGQVRTDAAGNRALPAGLCRQTPCPCPAGGPFPY